MAARVIHEIFQHLAIWFVDLLIVKKAHALCSEKFKFPAIAFSLLIKLIFSRHNQKFFLPTKNS